ncbi:MAG TPA: hypothetical protein DDW67_04500 [Elusimicrobia bacterium]|jgi:hypothetical protein|nr:hypothetical protein [Elusimicrobiota bacterium]
MLAAAPVGAQDKAVPPAGSAVSTATVAVSTAALSGPELKRLRNSEIAALRKRQAAEMEELRLSLKGKSPADARKAVNELRAGHDKEMAALGARHGAKKTGPVLKGGPAGGVEGEKGKRPPATEKKP